MDIQFERFGNMKYQAEGAILAAYEFQGNKSKKNRTQVPNIIMEPPSDEWNSGIICANGIIINKPKIWPEI